MIKYYCDWCENEFPEDRITKAVVSNVYNKPVVLHTCLGCGQVHMPARVQAMLKWTAAPRRS